MRCGTDPFLFPLCCLPFQQTAGLRSDHSLDGADGADLQPDKTVNDGKSFGKKRVCFTECQVGLPSDNKSLYEKDGNDDPQCEKKRKMSVMVSPLKEEFV